MELLNEILGSIWWLIVAIGILVTFHEYGHFLIARTLGVKVLRFSVGFGPALWSRTARDGVEYVIAAIPLGGYVKMLDEREGEVDSAEKHLAFNRQGVWSRIAIVAAGPVFNLIFTVLAFWFMFMIGVLTLRPVLGEVSGIAARAGLEPEQEISAVSGKTTRSWSDVVLALIGPALDQEPVALTVTTQGGEQRRVELPLDQLPAQFDEEQLLSAVGIQPGGPELEPVVGEVSPGSPAADAGLQAGDRIVALNGEPLERWSALQEAVTAGGEAGEPLKLGVVRGTDRLSVSLTPEWRDPGSGEARYLIGISSQPVDQDVLSRYFVTQRYGPVSAFGEALHETGEITSATLHLLWRMVSGQMSADSLSGPITIARYADSAADLGLSRFLYFLALLSLSLAILNLLPIPILDGGHLLYYLIELFKGSPVSERAQMVGQYMGLVLLAGLMGLAFYNDIMRLVST